MDDLIKKHNKKTFSTETIKRLSMYLRSLRILSLKKVVLISSSDLAKSVNVSSDQLRKDLSYFGEFGKRGVGYDVDFLIKHLEEILGVDKEWEIALVGVGRLGSALLSYPGFGQEHLKISVAFDSDSAKIGSVINGVPIESIDKFAQVIRKRKIKIGMLCVHADIAQQIADKMTDAGIKAILNFSPFNIKIKGDVCISRVDMFSKLESLIFFINENDNS